MNDVILRILWEDLMAWRRGEHRIAPRFDVNGRVTRGRIYAKRGTEQGPAGLFSVKARPKARMSLRVHRAATDKWEDPIEVSHVEEEER